MISVDTRIVEKEGRFAIGLVAYRTDNKQGVWLITPWLKTSDLAKEYADLVVQGALERGILVESILS